MRLVTTAAAVLALPLIMSWTSAAGQEPTQTPDAPRTAVAEASPTAEPSATMPVEPTSTPVPLVDTTDAISRVVQDKDGDGRVSQSDPGAQTLVELESSDRPLVSMYNSLSGDFAFRNVPAGEYLLVVWWSPGFIGGTTAPTNPGRLEVKFSVGDDGSVTGVIPAAILARELPAGLIPYPVRAGQEGVGTLPVGEVDVAAVYAKAGEVELPASGLATDSDGRMIWTWIVGLGALALAGILHFGAGVRNWRRR